MGGVSQKLSVFIVFPALAKWKSQFEYIGLSDNDIMKLYLLYNNLKSEKDEFVLISKLLRKFHFEDNAFMKKAMSTLVDNGTEYIQNFRDFVFTLWAFCTIERDMALLLYDIYDVNGDKNLDCNEADRFIKDVHGTRYEKMKAVQKLNEKMQYHSKQTGVTRFYFKEFALMNPLMVEPCHECCRRLQEHTLGKRRWDLLAQHRIVLLKGTYKTAKELRLLAKESDPAIMASKQASSLAKQKSLGKLGLVAADGDAVGLGINTPMLSRNDSVESFEGKVTKKGGGSRRVSASDEVSSAESFGPGRVVTRSQSKSKVSHSSSTGNGTGSGNGSNVEGLRTLDSPKTPTAAWL